MKKKSWMLVVLLTWLASASGWGTECRFFRIECTDGEAPENLAITMDESGQVFVEFDTEDQRTYVIEATDSLSPPAWAGVSALTGDGQVAAWLTTRRWSRTFGASKTEIATSIQQTSDGGYIAAGSTSSSGAGGPDAFLIKTDADGNEVWSRTFGGSKWDEAQSVQQTTDGGYIAAGWTGSFGAGDDDVYLIKTDADGNEVWSKTLGGTDYDGASSVQQTTDGGYIVAGYTGSFGLGGYDVYLIKTDADGSEVWSRTFGGYGWDDGYSVQQTSDGGYIVAGDADGLGAGATDAYLIKTDGDGNEIWSRTFGGTSYERAYSVQQTSDGGYIVAGDTGSFGAGTSDMYLVKTDGDGNETWSKTFGGTSYELARSVHQTSDGGYVVAGYTETFGAGNRDAYLIKTDVQGNEIWSRNFGGFFYEEAYSVQQTSDGGYIVAGYTDSFGGGESDVYLIKTDANGNAPPLEPALISVAVSGPNDVSENSSADYAATAVWDDGSTEDVTNSASWSPDSGTHYFSSAGHLVTGEVAADEPVTVSASYQGKTGSKGVTVRQVYVWSRTFGGSGGDEAWSVQQTSDGGYIVAGITDSFGAEGVDVYLFRTDADGGEVWRRTFGGPYADTAYSVQQTSDGGYILAGLTRSFGAGNEDVYLIKTNADGNEVWSRTFGGTDDEWARSVQQTSDGGYIVASATESFGAGGWDVYLIKTDAKGDAVKGGWSRTFGGTRQDQAYSVQQTSDGGYILASSQLIKTDANGNEVWSRTLIGSNPFGYSVQQTSDGGYIVAGSTTSVGAGYDVYLIKTDADGNEVWSRTFGGPESDVAHSVQQTSDGGYIVAGRTSSFGAVGIYDVYLIKTDANGNVP